MVETGATRQVAVVQGVLTIEGVPERFVQGFGRRLRLDAGDLRHVAGVASRDGRLDDATRILGRARLVGDRLQRAGFAGEAGQIGLTVRSLASSEEGRILLQLGFREGDEADGGGFFCDIFVPPSVFEALSAAVHAGTAQALSVSATTSLWVRESQRDAVPDLPVDWHLGLEADGRDSAPARGLVETLEWHRSVVPSVEAEPSPDDETHEAAADQLAALNWSLKQIALVLTFLLIVVALK